MATTDEYIDGFLRYDAFPSRSFAARGLPVPRFSRPIEVRGGNAKPVRSLAWSSDGKRIVTGTEGGGLRVWDVRPGGGVDGLGTGLKSPHPVGNVTIAVAWSPTEPTVLASGCKPGSSSSGGYVAVWDVSAGVAPLAKFKIPGEVLHIAWHPDGEQFAAVCPRQARDEVYFFQRKNGEWEQRQDIMMGGAGIDLIQEINSLRFWKGGDAVLCVSNDGSLNAWWYPVEERAPPPLSPSPEAEVEAKDEPPAKKQRLDQGSKEGLAEKPEVEADAEENGEENGEAEDEEVKRTRDEPEAENGAATPAAEGEAEPNAETDAAAAEGEANGGEAGETEGNADNADENPTIEVTGAEGAKEDVEMAPAEGAENADGAATPAISTAAPSPAPVPEAQPSTAPSPAPSPLPETAEEKGAAAVAAARAAAARELQRRKHKQLAPCYRQLLSAPSSLLSLAIHPQGKYLAVGGQDARVSLYSARDWLLERTYHQPAGAIRHIAFSPDGELLAVGGDDPVIFLIGVWNKQTVQKIPVHGVVNGLAWNPVLRDGKNSLAWSTKTTTGVVWYLANQE